jgi:hypothetical protein
MQIPILNGIWTENSSDIRTFYPVNMVPVPKETGISKGYLRPTDGIVSLGTGPGVDRGGIEWNGICYRVMGSNLVSVDASGGVTVLGDVGIGAGPYVTFDYSYDRLAIASNRNLFYWDGTTLTKVTDTDLGNVVDLLWIDGYFMTTDGRSLVVTELSDPTQVNPLKYGSSELDPDPVVALIKIRNEAYVLNRHTIEVFSNVGGSLFPFVRIDGAQIMKGVIGTFGCCVFMQSLAFLGSGKNEEPSIYMGANAQATKISTTEIDRILLSYGESNLSNVKLETRNDKNHQHLYVHLPDRTLVYDGVASQALGTPVWFVLTSSQEDFGQYRARNMVWVYDKWIVGDTLSSSLGYFNSDTGHHWGDKVRWEFGTMIIYNESKGAIFYEMELVALTGQVSVGLDPTISTSYSLDGMTWSQDRFIKAGKNGNRNQRLRWLNQGSMRNWRLQRFRGDSDSHLSFLRLEAQLEPLAY